MRAHVHRRLNKLIVDLSSMPAPGGDPEVGRSLRQALALLRSAADTLVGIEIEPRPSASEGQTS